MRRGVTLLVLGLTIAGGAAACGQSGGPQRVPSRAAVAVASPTPSPTPSTPPASPSPSGFPTDYAVPCAGQPAADTVVALLKAKKVVPAAATALVTMGPVCSGDWQYTEFEVTGLGPLLVVTRGAPAALELVTAGTDVCTSAVQTQAPPGIRALVRC